jgi:hypothetical protein
MHSLSLPRTIFTLSELTLQCDLVDFTNNLTERGSINETRQNYKEEKQKENFQKCEVGDNIVPLCRFMIPTFLNQFSKLLWQIL